MNVELRDLHKSFGPVRANDGVSLAIEAGTICGILGENGAGKSTLMKLLAGSLRPDRGGIRLDGAPVRFRRPADALRLGVGMLYQDPLDFPPMTVAENFVAAPGTRFVPSAKRTAARLRALAARFGFEIDPDAYVEGLTVGQRQQAEVLRLVGLGVKVLILDEPTTGISAQQKERLFAAMRRLAAEGRTILLVSHKLEDVEALCGRAVVLRQGRVAGEMAAPFDRDRLVAMMFGKSIEVPRRASFARAGEPAFSVRGVAVESPRLIVGPVDLDVRPGEVIGLAGVEGSGQGLFLRACAGLVRAVSGSVAVGGRTLSRASYAAFLRHGVRFIPASRLEEGLVPGLDVAEHCLLVAGKAGWVLDEEAGARLAADRIAAYSIRGTAASPVESLSGGNQQKTLIALIPDAAAVILAEHPARGLDVESAVAVWSHLRTRCRAGASVVFTSGDLEEILRYSDRVVAFCGGRASAPLDAEGLTVDRLGRLIGGVGFGEGGSHAA